MNPELSSQLQQELNTANAEVMNEALTIRNRMNRLIARLEAGGQPNVMDTLSGLPTQFESALVESITLARTLRTINEVSQ